MKSNGDIAYEIFAEMEKEKEDKYKKSTKP